MEDDLKIVNLLDPTQIHFNDHTQFYNGFMKMTSNERQLKN